MMIIISLNAISYNKCLRQMYTVNMNMNRDCQNPSWHLVPKCHHFFEVCTRLAHQHSCPRLCTCSTACVRCHGTKCPLFFFPSSFCFTSPRRGYRMVLKFLSFARRNEQHIQIKRFDKTFLGSCCF